MTLLTYIFVYTLGCLVGYILCCILPVKQINDDMFKDLDDLKEWHR